MDPANANVINYDTKTFLIHRAGHSEFDRETGKSVKSEEGFSEQKAAILQAALERAQDQMEKSDFSVQVNAIRQDLEPLSDGTILDRATSGIDNAMATAGMSDSDTIADYIFAQWKALVESTFPELTDEQEKLIIDRVMTDYYGALEGEGPLKSRGLETRQIIKTIGRPEINEAIVSLIKDYPRHFKEFIFPIESIIHRFAIEILRAVKSAYIIAAGGNEKEVARLQAQVGKAIETIEASGNEEAMEIIKNQVEKLSQLEDDGSIGAVDLSMISSPAEGIVFDYDGHTYKFTGGFAPANQILGLFKYGRKGIPAFDDELNEGVISVARAIRKFGKGVKQAKEMFTSSPLSEQVGKKTIAIYPGRFQPMGPHHFQTYQQIAADQGIEDTYVATSDKVKLPNSPLNFKQKKSIMLMHGIPDDNVVKVKNPYNAVELSHQYEPGEVEMVYFVGAKDMAENPRFQKTSGVTKDGYDWRIEVAPHTEIDIPEFGEMSGTTLRKALAKADPETFEEIMGSYDEDVYNMLRGSLQEMSSMGGGSIQGAAIGTGSKRGPWHNLDVEKENNIQKRNAKLRGADEFVKEELVKEVVDYLLGITVG